MFTKGARSKTYSVAIAAMAGVALLAGSCTSRAEADPTPVKVFKITPAPPTVSAGSVTVAAPTATSAPSEPEARIEIVGRDQKFDKTELTARAGANTIRFSNKDGGTVHNLHVYEGTDA